MSMILALITNWRENLFALLVGVCALLIFIISLKQHEINSWKMKYSQLKANFEIQNEQIHQEYLAYLNQKKAIDAAYQKMAADEKKYYADEKALYEQKYSEDCAEATKQALEAGQKLDQEWKIGD